jgi:hypothetical protein
MSYSEQELNRVLVNDVYKPKMHKVYSEFYTAVEATFCLNIRKTPMSLEHIHEEVRCKGVYVFCRPLLPPAKCCLDRMVSSAKQI